LLILANKFSEAAIGFLVANKNSEKFRVIAVQTPGAGETEQAMALQDLAVLTGGRALVKAAGDTYTQIRLQDFGRTRRAWADTRNFGIIGGKGDARALRQHIATLRTVFDHTDEPVQREKLRERIGKMLGGSATLWVGGMTEKEIKARTELAERTATALRSAMFEGVLPGGGAALLASRPALHNAIEKCVEEERRVAYRILLRALEEPTRTIALNAGHDDRDVMAQIKIAGDGFGFDAIRRQVVPMQEAGIYDPAAVVKSTVFAAISTAALALTIDTCVYPVKPEQAPIPRLMPQKRL
jgi:chaperonin GroEL